MDSLPCDVFLHALSFLHVIDASRFSGVNRRVYYLTKEYARVMVGPELVASASWDPVLGENRPTSEVVTNAIEKMHGRPNFCLGFTKYLSAAAILSSSSTWEKLLPPDAAFLGACASDIQVVNGAKGGGVESTSEFSLLLGSFHNVQFHSLCCENDYSLLPQELAEITPPHQKVETYWKAFILYSLGHGGQNQEDNIRALQSAFPKAVIMGGNCFEGHVRNLSTSRKTARAVRVFRSGTVGVAIGGEDVPVKCVASRGLASMSARRQHGQKWFVDRSETFGSSPPRMESLHQIYSIRNDQGQTREAASFVYNLVRFGGQMLGFRPPQQDSFDIYDRFQFDDDNVVVVVEGRDSNNDSGSKESFYKGAEIDVFDLDGPACLDDVEDCMQRLANAAKQDCDLQVLGAAMFSCNARGPRAEDSVMNVEMGDATKFYKYFPALPCLGFYAGGEIGPLANVAVNLDKNTRVFRQGHSTVQALTAVFAVFVAPKREKGKLYELDDSDDNVARYLKARFRV